MVLAVLALVVAGVGVGVAINRSGSGAEAAGGGCTGEAALRISAAPGLSAVLADYADEFDRWAEDCPACRGRRR